MRSQGDIKRELLRLRFTVNLPLKKIADDSGCSVEQIKAAMRLEGTESVCRRLDAYMDAKKMHVLTRESKLLSKIENMTFELMRFWNAKTLPMRAIYNMKLNQQHRLAIAMEWRLKRLLREKVLEKTGREPRFADGASYWKCKEKVYVRGEFISAFREPDHRQGKSPMGQGR